MDRVSFILEFLITDNSLRVAGGNGYADLQNGLAAEIVNIVGNLPSMVFRYYGQS